jgi:exodeoxyribonuclease V alpha subunit
LAYEVNSGHIEQDIKIKKADRSFIVKSDTEIFDSVRGTIERAISQGMDLLKDIQVLIPQKKGDNGITMFNKKLEAVFNSSDLICYTDSDGLVYKLGDKVMQLKNRPLKEIMNGDIGKIARIIEDEEIKGIEVDYSGKLVSYSLDEIEADLTLAYAITVHKSQGSEFKLVILPIDSHYSQGLYSRKLIYTAITRASQFLIMIGNENKLLNSVSNNQQCILTTLARRIQTEVQKLTLMK